MAPQQAPVEVTGYVNCGPSVRSDTTETLDIGEDGTVLTRYRGGAWQQTVTMSDPRLEGAIFHTYEADTYKPAGAADDGPEHVSVPRLKGLPKVEHDGSWHTLH